MNMVLRASVLILFLLNMVVGQSVPADSISGEIQLRAFLEKDRVPLNEEVVYHVELSWPGEVSRYRILEISDPVLTNLKLRGSGSANRFFQDKNNQAHAVKTITFYFTPLEMGMAYIDGLTIKYQDTKTNQTGRLLSHRIAVEISEPVARPGDTPSAGKIVVWILVAAFLLLIIYSLKRYFEQKKQQEILSEPGKTLEEQILEELKNKIKLTNVLPEKKFNLLMQLLKEYFKKRFELPPGSEFFEIRLVLEKSGISEELLSKLEQLFERAELVKFAAEPVNESELHFFIDTTELLLQELNKKD